MDNDDENGNGGGGTPNFVTKGDLKDFKSNHDETCGLKLLGVNDKIDNMENRIKFAIYLSTAIVGLVLITVQYYLAVMVKGM